MDNIDTLLFSGGAMRGIAYIGLFKKLRKKLESQIKRIAGVSVGSMFALLWIIGYTYSELREEVLTKNFKELHRIKISNVMKDWGLDSGDGLKKWMNELLKKKGYSEDITFEELYEKTRILLGIFATNILSRDLFLFDKNKTPKIKVIDAIMASMSIPFMFTCKRIQIEEKIIPFVDGAVISNLPVASLLEEWNIEEDNLLGVKLIDYSIIGQDQNQIYEINSISDYILNVSRCVSTHIHKEKCKYLIEIDISNMPHIDLNMTTKTKREIIKKGVFYNYRELTN